MFEDTTGVAFSRDSLRIGLSRKDTGGKWVWYEIETGQVSAFQGSEVNPWPSGRYRELLPGGQYYLEASYDGTRGAADFTTGSLHRVVDIASNRTVVEFDAIAASPAGSTELAIVAPAVSSEAYALANVVLLDLLTGEVTFVAETRTPFRTLLQMPLDATTEYIAWTDALCKADGFIHVFNRASGEISVLADSYTAPEHRRGGLDEQGRLLLLRRVPGAVFDLATMSYIAQLPPHSNPRDQPFAIWSKDNRFATEGSFTPETLCPAP